MFVCQSILNHVTTNLKLSPQVGTNRVQTFVGVFRRIKASRFNLCDRLIESLVKLGSRNQQAIGKRVGLVFQETVFSVGNLRNLRHPLFDRFELQSLQDFTVQNSMTEFVRQ